MAGRRYIKQNGELGITTGVDAEHDTHELIITDADPIGSGGPPSGPAGGDLTGTYPNPTVAGLAITDAKVAAANKDGAAGVPSLRTLGAGAAQATAGNDSRLSDSRIPTGTAGGDLTGAYPNPTLGAFGPGAISKGSATKSAVITLDAKGRVSALTEATISGAGIDTTAIHSADAAGGDLTGTYPNPTLAAAGPGATGPIGDWLHVPVITIDAKGRVSALTSSQISDSGITTVADTNYTATNTDRNVVFTSLTAARTVTLPDASTFHPGQPICIMDISGTCTGAAVVTVVAASGDTINGAASVSFGVPYGVVHLIQMSANSWNADGTANTRTPYLFTWHQRSVALPTGVWTPIPMQWNQADPTVMHPINASSTTIAAGSNSVALPTGTINVASTTGFATAGYITITGPPGANIDTVVQYTGVTATTFTGCTLGTGTMATGQVVKPANETVTPAILGIYAALAQVAFSANATGQRAVRLNSGGQAVGQQNVLPTNVAGQNVIASGQPLMGPTTPLRVEAYQDSGATLTLTVSGIQAPSLGLGFLSVF